MSKDRILLFVISTLLIVGCGSDRVDDTITYAFPESNKVLVLGIDGATWDVIDPLIESGRLPNFEALKESAIYGEIVMTEGKVFSPIVWTSMFTGVHPDRHGIEGTESSLSLFRRRKAVWNFLSDSNRPSTIINVPGTFPPERIEGNIISGFPMEQSIIGDDMGTFITLEGYEEAGHLPGKVVSLEVENSGEIYTIEFGFIGKDENDSFHFLLSYSGGSQEVVLKEDGWSSWLTFDMGPDYRVKTRLYLLDVVEGEGYHLYLSPLSRMPGYSWSYYYPSDLVDEVDRVLEAYVPHEIGWWKLAMKPISFGFLYEFLLDGERVRTQMALHLYQQHEWPLFIQVFTLLDRVQHAYWPMREPDKYDSIDPELVSLYGDRIDMAYIEIDSLIGEFLEHVDEKTIVLLVSDHGFHARRIKQRIWLYTKKTIFGWFRREEPVEKERLVKGVHKDEGVYIISGNPIDSGGWGDQIAIVDVAPTLLYLLGEKIPDDLDGEVLENLIRNIYFEKFPPSYIDGHYGIREVRPREIDPSALEQIKSMGYIE